MKYDVIRLSDQSKAVVLDLLDLSAAFDTTGHDVILSRLEKVFGSSVHVLVLFASYLKDRSRRVSFQSVLSDILSLHYSRCMPIHLEPHCAAVSSKVSLVCWGFLKNIIFRIS